MLLVATDLQTSMELIRNYTQLRPRHRGCVATIGNFDGVHRGHQIIFELLHAHGRDLGVPGVAVTFEPQPQEYFAGAPTPARLTRLREKVLAIRRLGIERMLCLRFTHDLESMPPQTFIEKILVDGLGVKFLLVGDDFRFGYKRQGDFETLREAGKRYGFEVADTPTFALDGERVSSTRVRAALERGELDAAAHLLGRSYSLCGRVAHGDKRGRSIGFPTANIHLHRQASPISGVFAVSMHGITERPWPGVANLGFRPTVGGTKPLLEVHLFDFSGDIYGRYVEVEFITRLREERRFASFEELRQQILLDAAQAREFLAGLRG